MPITTRIVMPAFQRQRVQRMASGSVVITLHSRTVPEHIPAGPEAHQPQRRPGN